MASGRECAVSVEDLGASAGTSVLLPLPLEHVSSGSTNPEIRVVATEPPAPAPSSDSTAPVPAAVSAAPPLWGATHGLHLPPPCASAVPGQHPPSVEAGLSSCHALSSMEQGRLCPDLATPCIASATTVSPDSGVGRVVVHAVPTITGHSQSGAVSSEPSNLTAQANDAHPLSLVQLPSENRLSAIVSQQPTLVLSQEESLSVEARPCGVPAGAGAEKLERPPIYLPCDINGKPAVALLDSGSSKNFISSDARLYALSPAVRKPRVRRFAAVLADGTRVACDDKFQM